jgi:hypothetical protein
LRPQRRLLLELVMVAVAGLLSFAARTGLELTNALYRY